LGLQAYKYKVENAEQFQPTAATWQGITTRRLFSYQPAD